MGNWTHRLTNIDPIAAMATCAICGTVSAKRKRNGKAAGGYNWACSISQSRWDVNRNRKQHRIRKLYRRFLKEACERCGFLALHKCQLDINHRDGDHLNDKPSNLETLCANCHRLVTYTSRHMLPRNKRQ